MNMDYRMLALLGMRRMISRLDRRPWSPTFGCFDREFWHYKTLIEFPRANFQQAMWGLAVLYGTPFEGNEFAGRPVVLDWLRAALDFWVGMRHADGSLDEWYLNEHSFCATAFTAAAAGETLLLLRDELDAAFQMHVRNALEHTVTWLRAHPNPQVANQMVAALVAHDCLRRISPPYETAFAEWRHRTLGLQHAEGWFPEYGGADIGYGLLTLDLLARIWKRSGDADIKRALNALVEFLSYFVHPNGSIGGDYSSRGTNHCFLYGLETLAAAGHLVAMAMVNRIRSQERNPNVLTVDDTYAGYFYVNSACLLATTPTVNIANMPPVQSRHKVFPGAGLVVHETDAYHAVISTQRGVWRACDCKGAVYGDSGYVAVAESGKRWTSACPEKTASSITQDQEQLNVELTKGFAKLDTSLPLRRYIVSFKMFSLYLLKLPRLAYWFARLLKRWKVCSSEPGPLTIKRKWVLSPVRIELEDVVGKFPTEKVAALFIATEGAGLHSPSSQMHSVEALAPPVVRVSASQLASLDQNQTAILRSKIEF